MKRSDNRLYVLVSDKLAPMYGAVQGGHAIAQWMLEHSDNLYWKNETVVYLSCDIEKMEYLLNSEDYSIFKEPDIGNEVTAIAVVGNERNERLFRRLKLLQ
jgi:hypothetical protein